PPKNPCRHAELPKSEPQTTLKNQNNRDANPAPKSPTLTPESPSQQRVCTEVLGAPKACAPVSFGQADEQADEVPAISVIVADDQADSSLPQDELVCGAEVCGPAGAFVVLGGAAYVPSGSESWYAGMCAAVAPAAPDRADDQAEVAQLATVLNDQ